MTEDRGPSSSGAVGIVVIGRNEGERLRHCLESLSGSADAIVYVDSGSTDGSRELARSAGARIVELDLSTPFTAARARNAGFARLMEDTPGTELVQFVDGDCQLRAGWIESAAGTLRQRPEVAVVCGRRRERFPEATVYNRLCDIEWDTPVGEALACGGDALIRVQAFRQAGGYDPGMIAGEEPDLCLRLRRGGSVVLRIDREMTLHDAAMTRWTQWWKRALRTGHTTAELLAKYGPTPDHNRLRPALSAVFWAIALPLVGLAALAWAAVGNDRGPASAVLLMVAIAYTILLARINRGRLRAGRSHADARAYALSCVLAKWPETWGMALFLARRVSGRRPQWIEYKDGPRGLQPSGVPATPVGTVAPPRPPRACPPP